MKVFQNRGYITVFAIIIMLSITVVGNLNASEEKNLLDRKVTINAEDAAVSNIISTLARLSGCNIVLAMDTTREAEEEAVEQKITINLKDVPIEQALSLVVKSIGLSYRLVGDNTFLVGEKDRIDEEVGERTYIINLNYVDVEDIVDALDIMPGSAVSIKGQNALLVRANPETFSEISRRLGEIDIPQKQIEIKVRLIEISVSEAQQYGIDWSRLNQLTTIITENPASADGVGLPYNYFDESGRVTHGSLTELGRLPEEQYFQKITGFDDVGHFSRQLTAFDITIDWLLENNAAQILTDTRLTALNGQEASIHIGEIVPFVVQDEERRVQVEREEVGIKLNVRPTINKDNQITARIEPEVSSVMELVAGYVPRTKVRRVNSTVTVPNGQKIVVGGLLSSNITTKVNKVPLLGDIPFLGKLFQHKHNTVTNTDLIIEITPRVVSFDDISKEFKVDERLERRLIPEVEE